MTTVIFVSLKIKTLNLCTKFYVSEKILVARQQLRGVTNLVSTLRWGEHADIVTNFVTLPLLTLTGGLSSQRLFKTAQLKSGFRRFLIRITKRESKLNSFVKSVILVIFGVGHLTSCRYLERISR